jgi:hypothetical protein
MRCNPHKTDSFVLRLISISLAAITLIGLLCVIAAFGNTRRGPSRHFLLPRATAPGTAKTVVNKSSAGLPAVSTHWIIRPHGTCCEGNLSAQGPSTYILLPVLVNGNKIDRSDDGGQTWVRKYPPVDISQPFGIEGDLNAWGDDIVFFGTEVTDGVCAHSDNRGESWTVVEIPVAFPANDQAWAYLGPFSLIPNQLEPYVLTGWYRIGSVALFSFDGGLTWPIQTPLAGDDGSGPVHIVCKQTAHAPTLPGDTRIPDTNFINHKAGRHGAWGTDKKFYWTETSNGAVGPPGNLYVCKTDNFGATWTGIVHPIADGPDSGNVVTYSGFDNRGTLYVLHGDKLYVSFNQGESFAFVHTLPRYGNGEAADGANEFFVANCGTIHIGLIEAGAGVDNVWYLRGTNVDTASPTWDEELVDVVGLNRLDFMQIVINGNGIPTISYTTPGSEVTTASRDAPMPGDNSCGIVPVSVVSRKIHGTAGTFDINLPLIGTPGIECRTGGANGDHDIVICFASPVTIGSVTTSCGSVSGAPVFSGNCVTIHLTGVPNASRCTVTLNTVSDGVNIGTILIPVNFLLGDTTANESVNSSDISQTKAQSGTVASSSNFRTDVTVNGLINSSDISTVKSKSGTALP